MSYIIFGDLFTFPEGEAATNRVHTYARGLDENGRKVHVICFRNDYIPVSEGSHNGIYYYYPFGQKKRSRYFIVRNWKKVVKFFRAWRLAVTIDRERKVKAVIVYSGLPATFLFGWLISRRTGSVLIQEVSEHPLRYYREGRLKKMIGSLKFRVETNLCDGIFCISHYLMDYYQDFGYQLHRLLLVPSTVDPHRFRGTGASPLNFRYIGYFGGLSIARDRIDMLVEAFAMVAAKFPDINLVLGGPTHGSELSRIKQLAEEAGIAGRLTILDYMPRDEIVKYIVNSEILVMVRAKDEKTEASFPSKLTEYLATGKPVISVNVGEISRFLKDGVNAFIVEADDVAGLAEKIDYILSDYGAASRVAANGKRLTETVFNYSYQARRIIPFVDSLHKS